jgi:hypothetical protein
MLKRVFVFSALLASMLLTSVVAAPPAGKQPLQVKPWVYDPDKTGVSDSGWAPKIGLPDAGKSNHGLLLTKFAPTPTLAASGASINFQGSLTQLGFDISNDSHCGAGAPRFNVYTNATWTDQSGDTYPLYYFFGCAHGIMTPAPQDPANWTRVTFTAALGFPSDGVSFIDSFEDITVTGIDIVFDEGTDVGPGYAILDNININGTLIGKPGAAK